MLCAEICCDIHIVYNNAKREDCGEKNAEYVINVYLWRFLIWERILTKGFMCYNEDKVIKGAYE